ncbi:MAG: GAF domain-containing protein, partial [Bacteroidota bacterium]|nr:GAF domain-containing protein [Bacteroidota bacterium]
FIMAKRKKILSPYSIRIFIPFVIFLGFLISIGVFSILGFLGNISEANVLSNQRVVLEKNKLYVNNLFATTITKTQDVALYLSNFEHIPERNRRLFFDTYFNDILESESEIYGFWVVFKPYSIDSYDSDFSNYEENITGQFTSTYYKIHEHILKIPSNVNDYKRLDEYIPMFNSGRKIVFIAPVEDPNSELTGNKYIVRIISPIIVSGKIIGIVGADVDLKKINSFIADDDSKFFILDEEMNIIYSNLSKFINYKLNKVYNSVNSNEVFIYKFITKKQYQNKGKLLENNNDFYSLDFLSVKYTDEKIAILITKPSELTIFELMRRNIKIFIAPLLIFLSMSILVFFILKRLSLFLYLITEKSDKLLKNDVDTFNESFKNKEFKNIQSILSRNRLTVEKYLQYTDLLFIEKYDREVKISKSDILINSLDKLKNKLKKAKEKNIEEIQRQEKEVQVSNALAQINDIQREHISDLEQLSYNTIKYICDFTKAVQGGFYILEEEKNTSVLNLISFYSYNRKVYRQNKIELGQGLAGTCALEQKRIYTKVPPNYLEITSGLGENPPKYILLLPLIQNEKLYGIIELAFLDYVEEYLDPFFESSTAIISSTIAAAKNTEQTVKLLDDTKKITQQMQDKEQSLETRIDELTNLREKSLSQEQDLSAILLSVNKIEFFAEFDLLLNVLHINDNLSEKLQILSSDATLLNYYDIFMISDRREHEKRIKAVLGGESVEFEMGVFLGKYNIWFKAVLTPVYDNNNEVYKIIYFGIDITVLKNRESEIDKISADLNEKMEQISVQESEMDDFFLEYQEINKQLKLDKKIISDLREEITKSGNSLEFIQNELRKRVNRAKRIELNLKKKIQQLEKKLDENNKN